MSQVNLSPELESTPPAAHQSPERSSSTPPATSPSSEEAPSTLVDADEEISSPSEEAAVFSAAQLAAINNRNASPEIQVRSPTLPTTCYEDPPLENIEKVT